MTQRRSWSNHGQVRMIDEPVTEFLDQQLVSDFANDQFVTMQKYARPFVCVFSSSTSSNVDEVKICFNVACTRTNSLTVPLLSQCQIQYVPDSSLEWAYWRSSGPLWPASMWPLCFAGSGAPFFSLGRGGEACESWSVVLRHYWDCVILALLILDMLDSSYYSPKGIFIQHVAYWWQS